MRVPGIVVGIAFILFSSEVLTGNNSYYTRNEAVNNAFSYLRLVCEKSSNPTLHDYHIREGRRAGELEEDLFFNICTLKLCLSVEECWLRENDRIEGEKNTKSAFYEILREKYPLKTNTLSVVSVKGGDGAKVAVPYTILLKGMVRGKLVTFTITHSYLKNVEPWDGFMWLTKIGEQTVYELLAIWTDAMGESCR